MTEDDIDVKCDYIPPRSSFLNIGIGMTYKQIFYQISNFIKINNHSNDKNGARYLEYPKFHLMGNKPECKNPKNCQQCYNAQTKRNAMFILCSNKRREIGEGLIKNGIGKHCVTDSLSTTARELFCNDILLLRDSGEYSLKSNWFANVYSFLQWQQKVVSLTMQNLADSNNNDLTQGVFEFQFESLATLNSYLDRIIEYLVLYYCCFDEKLWIAVFYPFIEAAIGTLNCQLLFAVSGEDSRAQAIAVPSLCDEGLRMFPSISAEKQRNNKEKCEKELKAVEIFRLLLCDVYQRGNEINDIFLNPTDKDSNPFHLTHKIVVRLNETVYNMRKQLARSEMSNKHKILKAKMLNLVDLNIIETEKKNNDEKEDDLDDSGVTMPSFISLFIINRIVKCVDGGIDKFKKHLVDVFNNKKKDKAIAEAILVNLTSNGIGKYMEKYFDEKKQAQIIQVMFDCVKEKFVKEYENEVMFKPPASTAAAEETETKTKGDDESKDSGTGKDESKTGNLDKNTRIVFNALGVAHYIFEYLRMRDISNCSLSCRSWLYLAWNPRSVYDIPLANLIERTKRLMMNDSNDVKCIMRQWQRYSNVKQVHLYSCVFFFFVLPILLRPGWVG